MKLRWKIALVVVVLFLLCAFLAARSGSGARKALEQTKRSLREQGFKLELKEFKLAVPPDLGARAAAITNAAWLCGQDRSLRHLPELMVSIGTNAAVALWKESELPDPQTDKDIWPDLKSAFNEQRSVLDSACLAALDGPFQFEPVNRGGTLLLTYLAGVKTLAQTLATRTSLELHDGKPLEAYTNLLALTRLTTAWKPEPVDITHLVRIASATIAENTIWQALQTNAWSDDQLARLQQEWESVDYFNGLPETVALSRANAAVLCQLEREESLDPGPGQIVAQTIRSPRDTWNGMTWFFQQIQYRRKGSYEDENQLMLYYRDRELELQRAVKSATWLEMRPLPGVTNLIPFVTRQKRSRIQSLLNLRQMGIGFQGGGLTLLGRASAAEARRRMLITALAVERYRLRNGAYPEALDSLMPAFLKTPAIDFMDGKPLRYSRTADSHFILYSIGLDCVDNQGQMTLAGRRRFSARVGNQPGTDLVWPRSASAQEVEAAAQQASSPGFDPEN
ncbi:hypothetical protein [Pedosphaera parvula]|uniref:Uncharacterized protein n=1 Tax=Pedosphaera parvula (strain Ellin514) TaxID=320771 RepID=B9XQB4_PEDPL|nr:hypothetical protein [Pedosphaera parvula]EEF57938.1 hypothetical protein Cflav_PD1113 [Pedosphaera parvula Ellin514]